MSERTGRPAESSSQDAQIRILLDRQKKSEFLPSARQKLTDTNFKLKNNNDEINSFFMDSCWSKMWNYVKLIRKVSVKWKN